MRANFVMMASCVLSLSACGQTEEGPAVDEAADFAARVGAAQSPAPGQAIATEAAQGGPPANADVKILDEVGYIAGVDLGQRAGTCAFRVDGMDKLMATGPAERTMGGKAVVRIGGTLYRLDGGPGGFAAVREGTVFKGEGITVGVQPTGPGQAQLTVTDRNGETKTMVGDWNC
ncbi:hypothetical protein [Qipengyuania sp.]|uniref:hypothetical protein n=1 Tax=Qipengyuania sp. TaxID=2004515 RepID=UPI0035C7C9CE